MAYYIKKNIYNFVEKIILFLIPNLLLWEKIIYYHSDRKMYNLKYILMSTLIRDARTYKALGPDCCIDLPLLSESIQSSSPICDRTKRDPSMQAAGALAALCKRNEKGPTAAQITRQVSANSSVQKE